MFYRVDLKGRALCCNFTPSDRSDRQLCPESEPAGTSARRTPAARNRDMQSVRSFKSARVGRPCVVARAQRDRREAALAKSASVLLGVGAAVLLAQGPASAASKFLSDVEDKKNTYTRAQSQLEQLFEQQSASAKKAAGAVQEKARLRPDSLSRCVCVGKTLQSQCQSTVAQNRGQTSCSRACWRAFAAQCLQGFAQAYPVYSLIVPARTIRSKLWRAAIGKRASQTALRSRK